MEPSSDNPIIKEPQPGVPERGRAWRIVAIVLTLHAMLLGSVVLIQGCNRSEPPAMAGAKQSPTLPEAEIRLGEDGAIQPDVVATLPTSEALTPEEWTPAGAPTTSGDLWPLASRETSTMPAAFSPVLPAAEPVAVDPVQPPLPSSIAPPAPPPPVKYTVKKGDTLTGVAGKHSVSVKELATFNGLSSRSFLKIGQSLYIPVTSATASGTGSKQDLGLESIAPRKKTVTHTVKAGETPSSIAKRYGVSVTSLLKVNQITDPRKLRINRKLTIPASGLISTGLAPRLHPSLREADLEEPAPLGAEVQGT